MIPRVVLLAVLVLEPVCLFASDTPNAQDTLNAARQQTGLLSDSNRPFVMDVDFTAQFNPPVQGHLRLRWEAKDRWWSRVSMGKFEQVKFQKGEWAYTLRNVDFTPKQVSDLMNLLHVSEINDKLVAREEKQRTEAGVSLDCIEAQDPDPKFKRLLHVEVCLNPTTHDIVTETRRDYGYSSDELFRD